MSLNKTYEFNDIIRDIIDKKEFQQLKDELHHGISRYHHCIRVAKGTYYITKKFNLNYENATKAALLHDFYTNEQMKDFNSKEAFRLHPDLALENAKNLLGLDKLQENIIASHMFPVCKEKPKYIEAWVTSILDKGVAIYEMYRYKASLVMGIWILFIFNIISIQK